MQNRAGVITRFFALRVNVDVDAVAVLALVMLALAAAGCRFDPPGIGSPDGDPPDAAPPADAAPPDGPPGVLGPCGNKVGYVGRPDSDSGYRYVNMPLTRDEAFAFCARDNAHLVVIDDEAENGFVGSLTSDEAWIGYDDLDRDNEFAWVNGSATPYTRWATNQPDNRNNTDEDCVVLNNNDQWHDFPCDDPHPFVCECEPDFTAQAVPACMEDAAYDALVYRGRHYRVRSPATWAAARDDCAAQGAHLLVVNDLAENTAIDGFVITGSVWLGYSDQVTEGDWQWVTGSNSTFERWGPGEPNGMTGESCAELLNGGSWNDVACNRNISYFCECDPGASTAP